MAFTFKGGVHVEEHKDSSNMPIKKLPPPQTVSIPLSQHIGAHCSALVNVGDTVKKGQPIGEVTAGLGCPVHSSVSGKVIAIEEKFSPNGQKIVNIVIDNDFQDSIWEEISKTDKQISELTCEEIIEEIRKAGISGMGGATFPTHAKISSAVGKVDRLIVNCAECEPYITANHRLLLEKTDEVIGGAKILLKALNIACADIAIEDNKPDAIKLFRSKAANDELLRICVLKTKYPQGDERQLIYALTGKEMPSGKLPADVGCVVFNAETCSAVYNALVYGMPLIERIVTVAGDCIKEPQNLSVPLGTPYSSLIEACGGLVKTPKKIINGGPMMGAAQWDVNAPVTKGTSAVLVFSKDTEIKLNNPHECIRCGRCVRGCPMHLTPNYLALYSRNGNYEKAKEYGVLSCVECGSCSYSCPAGVEIVQYIRAAKSAIIASRKAAALNGSKNNR